MKINYWHCWYRDHDMNPNKHIDIPPVPNFTCSHPKRKSPMCELANKRIGQEDDCEFIDGKVESRDKGE